MRPIKFRAKPLAAALLLLITGFAWPVHALDENWVSTWASSTQPIELPYITPHTGQFENVTIRQIVHTSVGGRKLRVRFSNRFGSATLAIGAASIARQSTTSDIVAGTSTALTFSGMTSVNIAAGATVESDPVNMVVPPLSNLSLSLYLPSVTVVDTFHDKSIQTNYVSTTGNHTTDVTFPVSSTIDDFVFVTNVDVVNPNNAAVIVALGDSITDGNDSTFDSNNRWPNLLAARLRAAGSPNITVVNHGISGNRILTDFIGIKSLTRFDWDVLQTTGVKYLVLLEGINDIGMEGNLEVAQQNPNLVNDMIAGYQTIIANAHANGIKIYGGTLMPFGGFCCYSAEYGESKRQAINNWIRTSGAFDAVIDFDLIMRDPADTAKLLPAYDSGDHIHPNDAGYQAMANGIDIQLFMQGSGYRALGARRH